MALMLMDTAFYAAGCRSLLRKEREHRQIPRREYGKYKDEEERHGHDRNDELSEIAPGLVPNARIADGRKDKQTSGGECGRHRDQDVGTMDSSGSKKRA